MRNTEKLTFVFFFWTAYVVVRLITLVFWVFPLRLLLRKKNSLLYLACWYPESAGYHYRVAKWKEILENNGVSVGVARVFKDKEVADSLLSMTNTALLRLWMIRRFVQIICSLRYEQVIVRRSLLLYNEYGNLFYERLLLAIHPSAILDIDDDLEKVDAREKSSVYGLILLENKDKFHQSLTLYHRFIAGSTYLKGLIEQHAGNDYAEIEVIPTSVDQQRFRKKMYGEIPPIIHFGWIGSNGNQFYIDQLIDGLNAFHHLHPVKLIVISGKEYTAEHANFEIQNVSWSLDNEAEELLKIDIGLMPLNDSKMERGKCGFKLIQYMASGIVPFADAVGANTEIIQHGKNGFLRKKGENWDDHFKNIPALWKDFNKIGEAARERIAMHYSFEGNTVRYLKFLGKNSQ